MCDGSKLNAVNDDPRSGAPICRGITHEHERGRDAVLMRWPNPGKEPAVKTVIQSKDTVAEREVIRCAKE